MARQQLGAAPSRAADAIPKSFIRYDIGLACVGKPAAGEVIGFFVAPVAFTLPANLAGSIARALTAANASAAWTLTRIPAGSATETTIATLTFAASGTLASFSTQAAVAIAVGDVLRLKAPANVDSALSDITFTIVGAR
ncbi:hypothetical protein [Methylobacterium sp. SI9]|uniref:hypothetical protein n=1 Tax=Methylobacterium guangdongense TaxID=3138811 RepID=UPI00313B10C3